MDAALLSLLFSIVTPIASGIAGWLVGRRKMRAEASGSEIENIERGLKIYRDIVEDLSRKIKEMESRLAELQNKLDDAETSLSEARQLINNYKQKIHTP